KPGEALVDEGVITVEQFGEGAVLLHDVSEETLGLFAHGAAEIAIEFDGRLLAAEKAAALVPVLRDGGGIDLAGEHGAFIDGDALDVAELEPLAGEIFDKFTGTVVGEHAFDLLLQV